MKGYILGIQLIATLACLSLDILRVIDMLSSMGLV